jgi:2-polyprenyl-3-methyl-5-hydroxy-6-metoxy-1,4-benzoquinol methylase
MGKAFSCKLCGTQDGSLVADRVRDSTEQSVYSCNACQHVQLFPSPVRDDNRDFYDKNRQAAWTRPQLNVESMRAHLRFDTTRRADFIEGMFAKNKMILELGIGYGFFMEEMIARGWSIDGSEISLMRREMAQKMLGKQIFDFDMCAEASSPKQLIGHYDLVLAFQVFEHVLEPLKFLSEIKTVLTSGGAVLLEVPNRRDHMIGMSRHYRDFYFQKAHVSYFNADDVGTIMERTGYHDIRVEYCQRYCIENAMQWLVSGKPQIEAPSFHCRPELSWLDALYRKHLSTEGISDTLTIMGIKY